jgi:putative phosphoribosyl transferase
VRFLDRADGGRQLAEALQSEPAGRDVDVVLGLPRGGVPVAAEVARALGSSLDVVVVRKLGVPFQPELAMGAIGEDGVRVENSDVMHACGLRSVDLDAAERHERPEVIRRAQAYRAGRPRVDLDGKAVLVCDDGIATGSTARAACAVARALGARRVTLAAPVASSRAAAELSVVADGLVVVDMPEPFRAVGEWYADFTQTTDDEVVRTLRAAAVREGTAGTERREGTEGADESEGTERR